MSPAPDTLDGEIIVAAPLNGQGIWKILLSLLITIHLMTTAWMLARIVVIESNRFTSADGKDLWKEIAVMRTELEAAKSAPPRSWFVDRVDKLDLKLDLLQGEVRALRSKP